MNKNTVESLSIVELKGPKKFPLQKDFYYMETKK